VRFYPSAIMAGLQKGNVVIAEIDALGALVIKPESTTEAYALSHWHRENRIMQFLANHNENSVIKGSGIVIEKYEVDASNLQPSMTEQTNESP
jgi:hypothetical protein